MNYNEQNEIRIYMDDKIILYMAYGKRHKNHFDITLFHSTPPITSLTICCHATGRRDFRCFHVYMCTHYMAFCATASCKA